MWKKKTAYRSTDSLIGHGGTLEGKVFCDTNLRIEGTFSGEIECNGSVTVGEQGIVRSSITAEEIVIAGKVYGDVTANRRLIMTGSGQLHGNIITGKLTIMEGGLLSGSVAMCEEPAPAGAGLQEAIDATDRDKSARPA